MNLPITPGYNLRKKYLPSSAVGDDHSLDQYIDYLKGQGIQVHPSIKPAMFSLSNGLLYPGLKTETELSGPHLLVKVPKNLLLTTRVANIPELQNLFEDDFYNSRHFNWEDRILCTFLLYIYGTKPKDSVWLHMVNNLSKQIDILCFWSENDIRFLNDSKVDTICKKGKEEFQKEWTQFSQVMNKNKGIIPQEVITRQNYLWLYIHLVSRSFGKFLKHVTMVPFCELFNHHNSDVLYDFTYNQSNPLKQTQSKYDSPQKYQSEQSRAQIQSSDGSYDSEDQFDQDEFNYSKIDIRKIKWGGKVSFNLKDKETQQVEMKYDQLIKWIHTDLYWQDFSIMLIAQVIQRMNIAKNQYMAGRKKLPQTLAAITTLKETCQAYKMKAIEYYRYIKGQKFEYRHLINPPQPASQEQNEQGTRFMDDKFDFFTMQMNKRDHFSANNQVYFCYGRLSNRMMLQRYGMALQGNKYDHVWVSLNIVPYIQGYPDTIQQMQQKRMSIKQKFKIKRREMNVQLIVFVRMSKWDLQRHNINSIFSVMDYDKEIKILMQCIRLLEEEKAKIGDSKQLQQKLLSKQTMYHEYFGTVYRLQHYKILELNITIYRQLISIIELIQGGSRVQQAIKPKRGDHQHLQLYNYLKPYFKQLPQLK